VLSVPRWLDPLPAPRGPDRTRSPTARRDGRAFGPNVAAEPPDVRWTPKGVSWTTQPAAGSTPIWAGSPRRRCRGEGRGPGSRASDLGQSSALTGGSEGRAGRALSIVKALPRADTSRSLRANVGRASRPPRFAESCHRQTPANRRRLSGDSVPHGQALRPCLRPERRGRTPRCSMDSQGG
jgi:hypothetical protein